jgi:hypothetical protein
MLGQTSTLVNQRIEALPQPSKQPHSFCSESLPAFENHVTSLSNARPIHCANDKVDTAIMGGVTVRDVDVSLL